MTPALHEQLEMIQIDVMLDGLVLEVKLAVGASRLQLMLTQFARSFPFGDDGRCWCGSLGLHSGTA